MDTEEKGDLESANEFIRRALQILTPDQAGFCGFYRPKEKSKATGSSGEGR